MTRRQNRASTAIGVAALVAACAVATVGAAPDSKRPRIVAATMLDRDRDFRADAVRLSYSERVRHAADRDGRYPFRIAGYRIRAVGKASGTTIVVALAEPSAPDGSARPAIVYRRTRAGSVVDLARNEAAAQGFRGVRPHGKTPVPQPNPQPDPQQQPQPQPSADRDGDGTPNAQDCSPDDASIHPSAPDTPDLAFVDSNCDGLDGNEKNAVFVSPDGDDGNPGTRAKPKREIAAAVAAASAGTDVYAAAGSYQRVRAKTGVDVFGGYAPKTWKRSLGLVTEIGGGPGAVYAEGARDVVLQLLTLVGARSSADPSAYGLLAVRGSSLTLQRVDVRAGNGAPGVDGAPGAAGVGGGRGGNGVRGACDMLVRALGGVGGFSPVGRWGGKGGSGVYEDSGKSGEMGQIGTQAGVGGAASFGNAGRGQAGLRGADGASGAPGAAGDGGTGSPALAAAGWQGQSGGNGAAGTPGHGGGGGGAGGGQTGWFRSNGTGNGGGGGGGGGGAGRGGTGGGFGGGSIGIYLHDSSVTVTGRSAITAANGGAGGRGGAGGYPGAGGPGGSGATHCTGEVGAGGAGGFGGAGGRGGGGGGGAGGPSIGVIKVGASRAALGDTPIKVGAGGAGGLQGQGGSGGTPATAGIARPVFPGP